MKQFFFNFFDRAIWMKMICNEIDSKHVKLGNPELKSRVKHDKIFELAIRRFYPF